MPQLNFEGGCDGELWHRLSRDLVSSSNTGEHVQDNV